MMTKTQLFRFAIIIIFLGTSFLLAQSTAKEKFFADYEKLIEDARSQNGEILSPEFFKKCQEKFDEANQAYEDKESQKTIRELLDESAKYAHKVLDVIKVANVTLENPIKARDAALSAEAPLYSPDLWQDAEKKFYKATTNIEDDDLDDAKDYGKDAASLYYQAELLAIKNGILGDARDAIKKAKEAEAEDYAYHTFTDAQNILSETERLLNTNREAKDEAIAKANKAAYQGRHAEYLANTIKSLSKKDENWENLILKFEEIISEFGSLFNYTPQFDQGFDSSVKTISAYIKSLKDQKKQLVQENEQLKEELNSVKEREATYSAELQKKNEREQKIEKIKSLFGPNEAKVIYEGDNLTIRLFGLNFPSGQSIIQPEYFSLLTKVQQALREFPNSHYLIEGHTDALGNANRNKVLSEQRAQSVREYLIANMDLDENQITHIGFGEEKPIASNETREGREQNRRIDVVISINE